MNSRHFKYSTRPIVEHDLPRYEPCGYHQLGGGKFQNVTAEAFLARLGKAAGAKNDSELADWLGVEQSLLSEARERNIAPVAWIRMTVERNTGFNVCWLVLGEGCEQWETDV